MFHRIVFIAEVLFMNGLPKEKFKKCCKVLDFIIFIYLFMFNMSLQDSLIKVC